MGMVACYQMADKKMINELLNKTAEEVYETVEELQEMEENVLDIDKMWDGLHFLLTDVGAAQPLEGNPLSEAIVGVKNFSDDEEADFITYIIPERVAIIMDALKSFDIEKSIEEFQPERFAQNEIYPNIWMREDKEDLQEELKEYFLKLVSFYEMVVEQGKGIIVSIY